MKGFSKVQLIEKKNQEWLLWSQLYHIVVKPELKLRNLTEECNISKAGLAQLYGIPCVLCNTVKNHSSQDSKEDSIYGPVSLKALKLYF